MSRFFSSWKKDSSKNSPKPPPKSVRSERNLSTSVTSVPATSSRWTKSSDDKWEKDLPDKLATYREEKEKKADKRSWPYPWSLQQTTFVGAQGPRPPFPRYGLQVSNNGIEAEKLLIFGGVADSDVTDDLYLLDTENWSIRFLGRDVEGEIPTPRCGHACVSVNHHLILWGGDNGMHKPDLPIYVFNPESLEWTSHPQPEKGPSYRYGHTMCAVDDKVVLFGGQHDATFFDDTWILDVSSLADGKLVWQPAPPSQPSPHHPHRRTGHVVVAYNGLMYLFGGTDGQYHYNDTWSFDPETGIWTELLCIGFIPTVREGPSAAIVDGIMYVFGGRDLSGRDLGDLCAFHITDKRWFIFQNMGPAPSARSGHALVAVGTKILSLAGESYVQVGAGDVHPSTIHVLDTKLIKYPASKKPLEPPMPPSDPIPSRNLLLPKLSSQGSLPSLTSSVKLMPNSSPSRSGLRPLLLGSQPPPYETIEDETSMPSTRLSAPPAQRSPAPTTPTDRGREDDELVFLGLDGTECEDFIRAVTKVGFKEGKLRDDAWLADYASMCFAGDALRWFCQQPAEVKKDWTQLREAMLEHYPAI